MVKKEVLAKNFIFVIQAGNANRIVVSKGNQEMGRNAVIATQIKYVGRMESVEPVRRIDLLYIKESDVFIKLL